MNAEIIAVGTELLLGQILNTNAQFLSVQLSQLGIDVYFQTVVGDNKIRLMNEFKKALERSDIIILTGGLGPTKDDLTKEAVAEVLNLDLKLHSESLERIKKYFSDMKRTMTESNVKQAILPEGCAVLPNDNGTAPGVLIEKDKKIVIMLPGPPKEMEPMFEKYVIPHLKNKTKEIIYSKVLKVFGIGESALEEKLSDIFEKQTNPTIAPYAKQGEVTLRITAKCEDEFIAQSMIKPVEEKIKACLGNLVYGVENETLEEVVANMLMEKNITIATAESCTGGLLAEKITRIPGVSQCFFGGVITYSNEAKHNLLAVSLETLKEYGAVSSQTALEMAEGVRKRWKADIGVSITGIAGPGGGTEKKPVGLVYVGISTAENTWYKELRLGGDREKIRELTTMHALNMVRQYLLDANV